MNKQTKTILVIVGILLIIYILYLWGQHNAKYKKSGSGQATLGPGYQIYPPVIYMPDDGLFSNYGVEDFNLDIKPSEMPK